MPSMSIRALLLALLLVCAVPVATRAEPMAAPARVFLGAQKPLHAAIDAQRPELQAAADALTGRHRRCVPPAGRPDDAAWTAIARYEDFDDLQQSLRPVTGAVRADIARLVRLRTGDRVIDRAARAQARMLRWMLALPPLDTCAMAAEWRSHHFAAKAVPAGIRALDRAIAAAPFVAVANAIEP